MSVDKLFQKAITDDSSTTDQVDDQGAYGLIRAPRERALMLELRKKDLTVVAIPYAQIEKLKFTPDDGITLFACGSEIKITGKNLNATGHSNINLFTGITRHRVAWVQEYSRTIANGGNNSIQIESINL